MSVAAVLAHTHPSLLGITAEGWVALVTAALAVCTGLLFWQTRRTAAAATRATQFAEHDMALRVQPYVTATVRSRGEGRGYSTSSTTAMD